MGEQKPHQMIPWDRHGGEGKAEMGCKGQEETF